MLHRSASAFAGFAPAVVPARTLEPDPARRFEPFVAGACGRECRRERGGAPELRPIPVCSRAHVASRSSALRARASSLSVTLKLLKNVAVAILLGAVGLVASYVPARRASRIDPATTIRQE